MRSISTFGVAACALAIGLAGAQARATFLNYFDNPADFGHVDQRGAGIINGPNACAPTSVYNSLVFLKNTTGVNITGANAVGTINEIGGDMGLTATGGGVSEQGIIDGKTKYINDHAAGMISVETKIDVANGVSDAAQFIYDQLSHGQDVELIFRWSNATGTRSGGGHAVTITGLDFDTDAGTGTIKIDDPWGGVDLTGNLTTTAGGKLIIGYTGGAAGNTTPDENDDNPGDAGFGIVTLIAAESVVPEPTTLAFIPMVGVLALRRRR